MAVVFADHLGSGDYSLTWALLAALVAGAIALSLLAVMAHNRLINVGAAVAAAYLWFVAGRAWLNRDWVTETIRNLKGPLGNDFQPALLDDFVRDVFGAPSLAMLGVLLTAAAAAALLSTRTRINA